MSYLVSLLVGLAVGVLYALLHVKSPAPPVIALLGLLGMVLGEEAVTRWKAATHASEEFDAQLRAEASTKPPAAHPSRS